MAAGSGRVEVAGRWSGVRGRTFVRPSLTVRPGAGGEELRALADLDHKPWAPQDRELWVAAFTVDADLDSASDVELSVAPDIVVALRRPGSGPPASGDRLDATDAARAPVAKQVAPHRRAARPRITDDRRTDERLQAATDALALERERRSTLDRQLDKERATSRRLQTELAQARAELELAHAAQAEAIAAGAELDAARLQLREAQRLREELTQQRDEAVEGRAALQTALHENAGALESAREALARERAEASRLRARPGGAAEPEPGGPSPAEPEAQRRPRPAADPDGAARRAARQAPEPATAPAIAAAAARAHRPLNPSLRHRTYWLGRALALLFLLAVLAAIYLVIHSTVTH